MRRLNSAIMVAVTAGAFIPGVSTGAAPNEHQAQQQTQTPVDQGIEEVLVLGNEEHRAVILTEKFNLNPDSAAMLKNAAGANVVRNGPLTGMAQYRGMSRFRVNTQINGMVISAGGPNWMDPPLSYAPSAHLQSLEVIRGIASVSAGQETIGGVVKANTWRGSFSDDGIQSRGRVQAGTGSADESIMLAASVSLANESHVIYASGLTEQADDAAFPGGDILPTEYERERFDVGYGLRFGAHTLRLDYARNETGDSGTPALPMDIGYIDSDLLRASWEFEGEGFALSALLHSSDIGHGMTNYELRTAPDSPSMWRRNTAQGENLGFALSLVSGAWSIGLDGHRESHDSLIDNPNNAMFFVEAFDDASRDVLGAFVERRFNASGAVQGEIGLRVNHVQMDADPINATPAVMGMAPAVALRDQFNAADRDQSDTNIDWVAKVSYAVNTEDVMFAGISRKSRSAAYQERYVWLPLQSTAGLADGRTYIGNIELDPEIAHEIEVGLELNRSALRLSPRIFYREVDDYIYGLVLDSGPAVMFINMMNMMNGTSAPAPLQFSNVDARFYGIDLDWRYALSERWAARGVFNYVRAERTDEQDDLYRIAPTNTMLALDYTGQRWGVSAMLRWTDEQSHIARENGELESEGYEVVDLHAYAELARGVRVSLGIENLLDEEYADHLAGVNRVRGNPDIAMGQRLPSYGRNVFASLQYRW